MSISTELAMVWLKSAKRPSGATLNGNSVSYRPSLATVCKYAPARLYRSMTGPLLCGSGSVASPERETEAMRDGSDAVADWPLLNAMLNVASGASWVSFHHGGGVGIGNSLHAGQGIVADGTPEMRVRLERVLTNDPGTGVARHADAGYEEAVKTAHKHGLHLPMIG